MKTKIQIKSILGNVLFEYECEDNTIKKTVEQAIKEKANLYSANLRSANLYSADLYSADLRSANLSSADLSSANLSSADLSSANLYSANLSSADLSSADLSSADLYLAKNKESAYLSQYCKWEHSILGDKIKIGCKTKSVEEWQIFFDSNEEYSTRRGTHEFKQIQAIFESYKAYLNHLNS